MRILMSVFACGPDRGSKEAVGWNWALEAARLGHQLVALTPTALCAEVEAEAASGRLRPSLRFEVCMPPWHPTPGHAIGRLRAHHL